MCKDKGTNRNGHTQGKKRTKLKEPKDILKRWTEYFIDLYSYKRVKDTSIFSQNYNGAINDDSPIFNSEVTKLSNNLNKGKWLALTIYVEFFFNK